MGDRGHIKIEQRDGESPVYLYAHWKATELPKILADALAHEKRWNDNEYLARIVFDELSSRCSEFTGCGISTSQHGDTWRVIKVDPQEQEVLFKKDTGYRADPRAGEHYSFEEFVENELGVPHEDW
jgi:hypothetical protein